MNPSRFEEKMIQKCRGIEILFERDVLKLLKLVVLLLFERPVRMRHPSLHQISFICLSASKVSIKVMLIKQVFLRLSCFQPINQSSFRFSFQNLIIGSHLIFLDILL